MAKVHDKAVRLAAQHAQPGETPLFYIAGAFKQAIACFSDRCIIVKPGYMAGTPFGGLATTFYYREITGVQSQAQMTTGFLEILTSSFQANAEKSYWSQGKGDSVNKLPNCIPLMKPDQKAQATEIQRLRTLVAEAHGTPVPTSVPTNQSNGDDLVSKLERLSALKSSGALSESDYELAKTQLLTES